MLRSTGLKRTIFAIELSTRRFFMGVSRSMKAVWARVRRVSTDVEWTRGRYMSEPFVYFVRIS